jgi:amino acid transporter
MVKAVLYSSVFGWIMLCAIVLAIPNLDQAAAQGGNAFFHIAGAILPPGLKITLFVGIALAQYLCGLATVTSASRMTYAFARDGGLPASQLLKRISPTYRTPDVSIWTVALLSVAFTVYTPVYSTITAVCVIFLYISYLMPIALGLYAYQRTWVKMGPWTLGAAFKPVAGLCILGCAVLLFISVQPPNDKALWITLGAFALTALIWFASERKNFQGPPQGVMIQQRQAEIHAAEQAVGQSE